MLNNLIQEWKEQPKFQINEGISLAVELRDKEMASYTDQATAEDFDALVNFLTDFKNKDTDALAKAEEIVQRHINEYTFAVVVNRANLFVDNNEDVFFDSREEAEMALAEYLLNIQADGGVYPDPFNTDIYKVVNKSSVQVLHYNMKNLFENVLMGQQEAAA